MIARLVSELTPWVALHGFGMKKLGLAAAGHRLTSADSMGIEAAHAQGHQEDLFAGWAG